WLRGSFVWFFDDTTVAYDTNFSGCFQHEDIKRQKESLENANLRLKNTLDFILAKLPNVVIEGAENRFGEEGLYLEEQEK
ncbi:MAG: hypothetical protein QXH80_03440, partial [Candidatus Nanoarchaeia archaeon]